MYRLRELLTVNFVWKSESRQLDLPTTIRIYYFHQLQKQCPFQDRFNNP